MPRIKKSTTQPKTPLLVKPQTIVPTSSPVITPDTAIDPDRPLESNSPTCFPVVGIGASAGGLAAFEAFFSGMPADVDPGMAFVLVQHLAPDHKSILTELIRRCTRMQVFEVKDGVKVEPNCAYIIPPGHDMAFLNGTLQLLAPSAPRGQRLPIDFFFRSLAQDQHERAICVVLSGTGSDGTQGVRAIKGEGGMVVAQNPESTEYDGMPRSAIATGLVDYVLPPPEMPAQIIAYAAHAFGRSSRTATFPTPKTESAVKKIFVLLRDQTGHDLSQYKPSTVHRRIERRMAVHHIETMDGYVKYLQETPAEVEALFRDLLIGVTSFFRDIEAFNTLEEEVIPRLFDGKSDGGVVRVWSVGCSTGEEPYSLAILLVERMETLRHRYTVQVFATDIDNRAIAAARSGLYPASIAADISPERLSRFFILEPDGSAYRVHKGIRDLLIFSEHDVTRHPPFSKLDLISCRNLLIYMDGDLQKKIFPLFHYALNPDSILFLGTSETVGEFSDLFVPVDRKSKIYQHRKEGCCTHRAVFGRIPLPSTTRATALVQTARKSVFPGKLPLRELTEQAILQQIAPACVLVNSQGDILYLHGRTGMYLEPTPGEPNINNILKMAREGLRQGLTSALRRAVSGKELVRCQGLRVKTNGDFTSVNVSIHPVSNHLSTAQEISLFLVIMEEAQPTDLVKDSQSAESHNWSLDSEAHFEALNQELRAKEEYLQTTHEELETSNEELKSSSEEMQSVNEELQSTNEELETSKEELQSVNEELATVNAELQNRVMDLSRSNNDMNNLLAGTGIATVFVDHRLRILRFTPTASAIINLIPSDTGRPVSHIVSNLVGYDRLIRDVQSVLETLIPVQVDVQTTDNKWYTMRIQPYRTLENVIEGAVITFIDITEMTQAKAALQKANALSRLAVVVRDANDAITVHDLTGRIVAWNPGAEKLYGWSEAEAQEMNIRDTIPDDIREETLKKALQISRAETLEPYRTQRLTKDGRIIEIWMTASALVNEAGKMYAIATTERINPKANPRPKTPRKSSKR